MRHGLLAVVLVVALPPAGFAQPPTVGAVLTTAHFAFYSALPTNAHDALIAVAIALFSDRFREIISRTWQPQMDGARTLDEAAVELVRGLNAQGDK
jgi:hypothetical protein